MGFMGIVCCRRSRGLNLAPSVTRSVNAAIAANKEGVVSRSEMMELSISHEMKSSMNLGRSSGSSGTREEALHSRALDLWRNEQYQEALTAYTQLYELEKASLGDKHPRTINSNENCAHLLVTVGRQEEAIVKFDDVVMTRTLLLGRDHSDTLAAKLSQAALLENMARTGEALLVYEELLQCAERCGAHDQADSAIRGCARLLYALGRYPEALQATDQVLATSNCSETHPDTLALRRNRAQCLHHAGRADEAINTYRDVLRLQEESLGVEHDDTLSTAHSLAMSLDLTGERDEAAHLYDTLLHNWRAKVTELSGTLGDRHPRTLHAKSCLASVLQSTGVSGINADMESNVVHF